MKAEAERGEVISMMGFSWKRLVLGKFIAYLEKVARRAFWDTRVLMAHLKQRPSTEERFLRSGLLAGDKEPGYKRNYQGCSRVSNTDCLRCSFPVTRRAVDVG